MCLCIISFGKINLLGLFVAINIIRLIIELLEYINSSHNNVTFPAFHPGM